MKNNHRKAIMNAASYVAHATISDKDCEQFEASLRTDGLQLVPIQKQACGHECAKLRGHQNCTACQ